MKNIFREEKIVPEIRVPLISFCIPTFRRKKMLSEALGSIFSLKNLDIVPYEIIISDDEEAEDMLSFVSNYEREKFNIRIYKNLIHGQFPNLNNLINRATGEWIIFIHDDDLLSVDFLEKLLNESALETPEVDIIWFARTLINFNGVNFSKILSKENIPVVYVNGLEFAKQWLIKNDGEFGGKVAPPMVTGIIVRRSLVKKVGGFPLHLSTAGDSLFLIKLFVEANTAIFINSPCLLYRFYQGSQRSILSENGKIYEELKTYYQNAIDYVSAKLFYEKDTFIKDATNNFYSTALKINGPIGWLALHFQGSIRNRFWLILLIIKDSWKYSPFLFVRNFPLVPIALHFVPRLINKHLGRLYIRLFF